jgi:hypothetical protein
MSSSPFLNDLSAPLWNTRYGITAAVATDNAITPALR